MLLYDYFFGSGDRFQHVKPHPFWIIILIVTVQYGTLEGIMSVALCTTALYAGEVPKMHFGESLFEYDMKLALTPTLWFIAAVVLGEMHMRTLTKRDRYRELALMAQEEAEKTAESYELLKDKKELLEVRLASHMRSFTHSLRSFKEMESMSPAQIFMSLTSMVHEIIGPKKFSIWTFSESGFEVMLSEGWKENEPYKRRFTNNEPLFQEITAKKRIISVINAEDEVLLEDQGLIVAPILNAETGQIFGMLKIEEIAFYDLNISNLWIIENLTELIGTAFSNAQKYDRLERHSVFATTEEKVFSYFMYTLHKNFLACLMVEARAPMAEISIALKSENNKLLKKQIQNRSAIEFILNKSISNTESVYSMGRDEIHYRILLPLKSVREAEKKMRDIEAKINEHVDLKLFKVNINSTEIDCSALIKSRGRD